MAIEDLIRNTELLKRVLDHYKYRLENFTDDEDIKPLMSGPLRRYSEMEQRDFSTSLLVKLFGFTQFLTRTS